MRPPSTPAEPEGRSGGVARRLRWVVDLPIWCHALGLGLLLLALLPMIGPYGSISMDEGAAAHQAIHLEAGGGWSMAPPIQSVDSSDLVFPITKSELTDDGWAPFARHPLYAVLLAGAVRASGHVGMVLVSIAGLVAAAAAAARLALAFSSRPVAVASLWWAGAGSPLLFDGYLLIAHTLGAAAVGWAMVLLVDRGVGHDRDLGRAVLVGLLVGTGVLLRAEVFLVGLAATAVLVACWVLGQPRRSLALIVAPAVGSGVGLAVEAFWRAAIGVGSAGLGGPSASVANDPTSWLSGRLDGLVATLIDAGGGRGGSLVLLSVVLLLAVAVGARVEAPPRWLALVGAASVACLLVRLAVYPSDLVPGLLVAFPGLLVAAVVASRRTLVRADGALLVAVAGIAAVAIILVQYPTGGSVEWGGRYFAVLLPLVVPVVAHGIMGGAALSASRQAVLTASVAACSVVLAVLAVGTLRDHNHRADGALEELGRRTPPTALASDPDDRRPVVITTEYAPPRSDWRRYAERRWVYLPPGEPGIDPQAEAIEGDLLGPRQVTVLSVDLDSAYERLGRLRVLRESHLVGPFYVSVVELG